MELRGQDKEIGMPSSLVYHRESSSTPINSAVGESRSDAILNQPQALDQQHPLLYNQLNPHPHPGIHQNKPRRDPELDIDHPDPVPASIATTSATANRSNLKSPARAQPQPLQQTSAATAITTVPLVRYRECLKNHAANIGGLVMDGCGEFMPSGEEGTKEALKCAACDCHRNFHRKEIDGEPQYASNSYYNYNYNNPHRNNTSQRNMMSHPHQLHPAQVPPLHQHHRISYASPSTIAPMMMNFGGGGGSSGGGAAESSSEDLNMYQSNAMGQTSVHPPLSKKRFRTKFSQEQKDKMLEFAEKLGWKMQKQDEEEVQQFCAQVGVKRQVFKVWMHNNKQANRKKQM